MVLTVFGCLFSEWVLLFDQPSSSLVKRIFIVDAVYGLSALGVLIVGCFRVIWGLKPAQFYTGNFIFWIKMMAFLVVGLLSIPSTLRFIKWRRSSVIPTSAEISSTQVFVTFELVFFAVIPICAALMARGYGS